MHGMYLLFVLLLSQICSGFVVISESAQSVIRVPKDCPTIQQAVNIADNGDVIFVAAGTYYEHVLINKTLTLVGEDPSITVIDGDGTGTIIQIDADNVVVDGFTLRNASFGIFLNSNGNKIANNKIMFCWTDGISANTSDCHIIRNNELLNNGDGYPGLLWGGGVDLVVSNCNIVSYNFMSGNVFFGVAVMLGQNNLVTQNVMDSQKDAGILLFDAVNNSFIGNTIRNNSFGIDLISSYEGTYGNIFYHNNLVGNIQQEDHHLGETPYSANSWNNSSGEGNYWSDYKGEDLNGDLLGDTNLPHRNVDYYPLMIPYGPSFYTFNTSWEEKNYSVTVETDSAITAFNFTQTRKELSFNATCPKYAEGFFNFTIPKELLKANSTHPWKVILNSTETEYISTENITHSFLYLNVTAPATYGIYVFGSEVIPEFSLISKILILPTLILMILFLRKRFKKKNAIKKAF